MLSLILPPFIVLVALGGLLYVFSRKLPEVEEKLRGNSLAAVSFRSDRIRRFFLSLVEYCAQSFKKLPLQLYNWLHRVASKARKARERAADRIVFRKDVSSAENPQASERKSVFLEETLKREVDPDRGNSEAVRGVSRTVSDTRVSETSLFRADSANVELSSDGNKQTSQRGGGNEETSRSSLSDEQRSFSLVKEEEDAVSASDLSPTEEIAPLLEETSKNIQNVRNETRIRSVRNRTGQVRQVVGDAVRRFRPARSNQSIPLSLSPETELALDESLSKKDQLEEILIERISMNPRDIEAYERLGDYYLEQDNLTDAKECYRQVLKLSPAYRLVKIKIRRLERLLEKR